MEASEIITEIVVSKLAEKQLKKSPRYIDAALRVWAQDVRKRGIREVRKFPGYHDEPLQGKRFGQRSVRLNRAYRAIYIEMIDSIKILVLEVTKHGY